MTTATEDSKLNRLLEAPRRVLWLYLAAALCMTFPLALRMRSALPAGSGDVWQNYWNFWWWKTALIELQQSPYHSQYLFHPAGADLIFHTHSPFNMIVGMPVNLLWGEAAAYDFCILLGLWMAGWGMYLLVKDLTEDSRAAFLAGIIFAYFPQHLEQTLEHLNLASVQFLPLTLWFFFRTVRGAAQRNVVGLGACFALNALCSWHLGMLLFLLLGFAGVWEMARAKQRRRELLIRWGAAGILAAVLIAPAAWPMIAEDIAGEDYFRKPPVDRGIDGAYLFTPPYAHPFWGTRTAEAYADRAYDAAGFMSYLGFVPVVLAVLGLWGRRQGALFWACVGLGGLVLSLGAHPWWNGVLHENISLPFALWPALPPLDMLRVANRFLILTSIGLAVLAGFGASRTIRGDGKFLVVCGLVMLEYLWVPYPMQQVEISPLYEKLAAADGDGAVLDIPFLQRNRTAHNLPAQTVHRRPIGGGYLSTVPPSAEAAIRSEPALAYLAGVPSMERPLDDVRLRELGFDWVVLHKYRRESRGRELAANMATGDILEAKRVRRLGGIPDEIFDEIRRQLTAQCGPPFLEDDEIAVFDLRGGASTSAVP